MTIPEQEHEVLTQVRDLFVLAGSGHGTSLPDLVRELLLENRRLRDVLTWTNNECPGKCAGVIDKALQERG